MAFQKVTDTAAIHINYTQNGEAVQNTFYAKLLGGYVLSDLIALAANIDDTIEADWRPDQVAEAVYVETEVRGLAIENDLIARDNTGGGPGTLVSAPLPNNVTISIKKESGFTGRSARGRTYWIGAPRTELDAANENLFTATYLATVVENVDKVRIAIGNVGLWTAVLVSRFANGSQRTEGVTFPWITTSNVDLIVDSQRGRLPG